VYLRLQISISISRVFSFVFEGILILFWEIEAFLVVILFSSDDTEAGVNKHVLISTSK